MVDIKRVQSKWEQGRSSVRPETLCHSLYYFPHHMQHLAGVCRLEDYLQLKDHVKKAFLQHLHEVCFNIIWEHKKPTPIFFQFWDETTYWIGFAGYLDKWPNEVIKFGVWNQSVRENTYWCEIVYTDEFKFQKNPIKELPEIVINKVYWDEVNNQSEEVRVDNNVEAIAEYLFKNEDHLTQDKLAQDLSFFNNPKVHLHKQEITREDFKEWFLKLEEDDQKLLAIEIMGKKVDDPRQLDPDFIKRLYDENLMIKSKNVRLHQDIGIIQTKLKMAESRNQEEDTRVVDLQQEVDRLKNDNEYLKMRINALVSKKDTEKKQALNEEKNQEFMGRKHEKLRAKYENLVESITGLERTIFELQAENSTLLSELALYRKKGPPPEKPKVKSEIEQKIEESIKASEEKALEAKTKRESDEIEEVSINPQEIEEVKNKPDGEAA